MAGWQQISELIYGDLASYTALTSLLSNGVDSIYPLIADAEEGDAFITYFTEYEGKPSKDGVFSYSITVQGFAPTYNASLAIAEQVINAFTESTEIYSIGYGKPVFISETQFYIEQIFNLKK